jgi:hypothetical protein
MLKFSQFINEYAQPTKKKDTAAQLGLAIEPEEEAEYSNIVNSNIDDPNTAEVEAQTGDLSWQDTNKAVSNYVGKQVADMKRKAGL